MEGGRAAETTAERGGRTGAGLGPAAAEAGSGGCLEGLPCPGAAPLRSSGTPKLKGAGRGTRKDWPGWKAGVDEAGGAETWTAPGLRKDWPGSRKE